MLRSTIANQLSHDILPAADLPFLGLLAPARTIPKNTQSVTGVLTPVKPDHRPQAFESTLERDLLILLDSDPSVRSFLSQPVEIHFIDREGKKRTYTPDLLADFYPAPSMGMALPPLLAEVKPRAILFKDWEDLKPKFVAARAYAKERGWRFRILTEQEIRPKTFLPNLKWLRPHLRHQPDPAWVIAFLEGIRDRKECTITALLDKVCPDKSRHPEILPHLWHLLAARQIWTDLRAPLQMTSVIRHALRPDPAFLWGAGGPPLRTRRVAVPETPTRIVPKALPMVDLAVGAKVAVRGNPGTILKQLDLQAVLIRFEASGIRERVPIGDLQPYVPEAIKPRSTPDLAALVEEGLKEAIRRDTVIRPLAGVRRTRAQVEGAARSLDVTAVTVYRWLKRFVDAGQRITALVPHKPDGGRGKSRLVDKPNARVKTRSQVESVISETIEAFYLSRQKHTVAATVAEVFHRCDLLKLPRPAMNTVRKRISWVDPELALRRRQGSKVANQAFRTFPSRCLSKIFRIRVHLGYSPETRGGWPMTP